MSQPQYYQANPEAARTQQRIIDQNTQRRWSNRETELENGITVFRLLPPWGPSGSVSKLKSMWFKNKLGWTSIQDGALPVVQEMWPNQGIEDPIMNALIRISQFTDVSDMFPQSPRFLINALILSNTPEGGSQPIQKPDWYVPKVLRVPKKGNDWLHNRIADPHMVDISDPYQGYWLGCTKTGSGLETRYDWTYYADYPRAISDDVNVMQQIVAGINDLDKFVGEPNNDMMVKQQAVADELLRKYNIHGAMAQGVGAPNFGAAPPVMGAPQGPTSPVQGASAPAPTAPGAPQPPTPAAPPMTAPTAPVAVPAQVAPPPAPVTPAALPQQPAGPPAQPVLPAAAPPAAPPTAYPAPPAGPPAQPALPQQPMAPTSPPAAPAAPPAPAAPVPAAPPAAPAPMGGAQPPFPGSAIGTPPVAPPLANAGVPIPPAAPTSGPVPNPVPAPAAPAGQQPVQGKKEIPDCFAGLSETNPFLNDPKCRTCWKEVECSQMDLKRTQGPSAGILPDDPVTMSPIPAVPPAAPTSTSPPAMASAPVPASMPVPAAEAATSVATMPTTTAVPSPSEAAPAIAGTPPCMGNKARNLPPADGLNCDACMYATPCEIMKV